MSAFMVDETHIDALLTAGLAWSAPHLHHGPVRWMVSPESHPDYERAYEAGEPWGPAMLEVYDACRRELTTETAGRVGAMLLAENRRSVDFRYNESELEEPYEFHQLPTGGTYPDPKIVLGALSCYEYQACETPDWKQSEAFAFCDALRHRAISMILGSGHVWEITDRDVFKYQHLTPEKRAEVEKRWAS